MNDQTLILTITLILGVFIAYKLLTTKDKS
jgi:hypothetical protein